MTALPRMPTPGQRFANRLIAVSVAEAEDLTVLGLPADMMDQALQAVLVPLVAEGARIAYAGRIEYAHHYTLEISEALGETFRPLEQQSGRRPFVHVVAAHRWGVTSAAVRFEHLQRVAPYGEIWVTGADAVTASFAAVSRQRQEVDAGLGGGPHPATATEHLSGPLALARSAAQAAVEADEPAVADDSYVQMRQLMAGFCDARVLAGGRKSGFAGRLAGVCEEALETLTAGRPLVVLGGFGGASRDVAAALGLLDAALCVPRKPGQDPHGLYEASLQALRDRREAFAASFSPETWALACELAATESLAQAAIGTAQLLAAMLPPDDRPPSA